MIISRLAGGLGNQMFQYAIARAYSLRTGYDFKVDTFDLNRLGRRKYELDAFVGSPDRSTFWDRMPNRGIITDERLMSPEHFTTLTQDNLHLIGYWQNEGYFKDSAEQIRRDFKWRATVVSAVEPNSVAVHIRRGDYVGNAHHPVQPVDYYLRAFEIIESEIKDPVYYLFSDSKIPGDFYDTIKGGCRNLIYWIGRPAIFDLEMMKRCRHNIIANSSFSWWGAWLNENPDKIVVAPEHWFNGQEFGGYCPGWQVI